MNWRNLGFGSFLEKDEHVVQVFRKPLFLYSGKMLARLIGWGCLAAGAWFLFPTGYPSAIWIALVVIGMFRVFSAFIYWYINGIVMTNGGLVFVNWPTFFEKRFTRVDYQNIDQINVEKIGVRAFFGNYGTIQFVKMGGDIVEINDVNCPNAVARGIEDYQDKVLSKKNFTDESALKDLIAQMVMTHSRNDEDQDHPKSVAGNNTVETHCNVSLREQTPKKPKKKVADGEDVEIEKVLDDTGGIDINLASDKTS